MTKNEREQLKKYAEMQVHPTVAKLMDSLADQAIEIAKEDRILRAIEHKGW